MSLTRLCLLVAALSFGCSSKISGGTADGGTSTPPAPPATGGHTEVTDGTIGSACGACGDGLLCATELPGGYCSKECTSPDECGANAHCYSLQAGGAACLRACTTASECRSGYDCKGDPGAKVCAL